jgi:glycosidase
MKKVLFLGMLLSTMMLKAQLLEVTPAFPIKNDVVTIIYDATQGNAALVGQTQIYAHTGVITSTSTSITNWQFTKGQWGTPDASVAMTNLGNNKHSITINIPTFYGFPASTNVLKLAFVFRTANGQIVGRSADGSDIYYDVFPDDGALQAKIFSPASGLLLNEGEQFEVNAKANQNATIILYDNGNEIHTVNNSNELSYTVTAGTSGNHTLKIVAETATETKVDSIFYVVNPTITPLDPPAGLNHGINYINETTVILKLHGPFKQNIYVLGDFNNWVPSIEYHMNRASDNETWWLELSGLTPGQRYGYQYYIDGELRLADPMSPLILDPNNDGSISAQTYPNPHPYPVGKTTGFVTIMQPGATPYEWQVTDFQLPANKDLMIYELHVRDFVAKRNYQTLIDTLDYLVKLGINAIELMPPGEFENNESWGYNPSFHMALDKYYGTPEKFKEFVDSCHSRGIAVIVDMVLNHAFGQSPMVRMYWDAANDRPAANSPWFNAICPHEPFCWGYDYDHTRQVVKDYMDEVNLFWMKEYNIDGFRFDYTKGFINNANGYDDTRIDLLKRMADVIWDYKSDAYVILEHWCDNNEERQLAEYGMMLWGNLTYNYHQAGMGFTNNGNLSNGVHLSRGWNVPHLITYVESHDEERAMYEAITYGNTSNPNHNVRTPFVALGRMQALAVICFTTPGPKMIWQFGELGYDISIDNPCRVCNKPILWNYFNQSRRRQTYDVYSAVLNLRKSNPTFQSLNFNHSLSGAVKRIRLTHPDMNAVVLANFAVNNQTASATFHSTGWWYEFFSGDSLLVENVEMPLALDPGSYFIYTSKKLPKPFITESTLSYEELELESFDVNVFPNPSSDLVNIYLNLPQAGEVEVLLLNQMGQVVRRRLENVGSGFHKNELEVGDLPAGTYHILVKNGGKFSNKPLMIQR